MSDRPQEDEHPPDERQEGVGVPDGFDRLWTPHRLAYIKGEGKPADASAGECPFCRMPTLSDDEALIVRRGRTCFAVLNLYPYTAGHLLVCPYRHVADYTDLTEEEVTDVARLTREAMTTLRTASAPQGFNIGLNQGNIAGAGIAAHLHQHVVPRWGGDANFMPVIGQTKVLPELLTQTRETIAQAWHNGRASADGADA
ncbi:MAG: HIT family protein [Nocardioidaceae bacterium]